MRNTSHPLLYCGLAAALPLLPPAGLTAEVQTLQAPEIVSPGETGETVEVASVCPTFSWTSVPGAASFELVVYSLSEDVEAPELSSEPVLTRKLPSGANSWTPAMAQCLIAGQSYAWSVGASAGETAAWSDIQVFRVSEAVERSEMEQALERVLTRFLEQKRIDEATAAALRADPEVILEPSLAIGEIPVPLASTPNLAAADSIAILANAPGTLDTELTWGVVGTSKSGAENSAGVLGISESTFAGAAKYGVLGVSADSNLESAGVGGQGKTGVLGVGDVAKNGIGIIGVASALGVAGVAPLGSKVGVVGIGDEIGVQGKVNTATGVAGDFRNSSGKGLIVQGGGGQPDIRLQTGFVDVVSGSLELGPGDKFSGTFEGNGTALTGVVASNTDTLDNLDSTQFLRSDQDDSYDGGNVLTIVGTLGFDAAGILDATAMTGSGRFKLPTCAGCITGGGIDSGLDADRLDGIQSTGFARLGLGNAGTLSITDGTDSINKDTGSILTDGGIGIEKNVSVGGKVRLKTGELISNETGTEVLIEEGAGPNALLIDVRDLSGGLVLKGDNEDLGAHPGVAFTLQSEEAVGSGNKGGDLALKAGAGGGGNSVGGAIELVGGMGTGTSQGGDIILQPGATGTGTPGRVKVKGTDVDFNSSPTTNLPVRLVARQSSVTEGTILFDPVDTDLPVTAPAWNISPALDLTGSTALVLPVTGISGAGHGSGLDADLLDGLSAGAFLSLPLSEDLVFANLELIGNLIDVNNDGDIDPPGERAVDKVLSFAENMISPDPGPTEPVKILSIDMRAATEIKLAADTNNDAPHVGASLSIAAEDAISSGVGVGGNLNLASGKGGVNSNGGDVTIAAGDATANGLGGDLVLTAGAGADTKAGGGITLAAGGGDVADAGDGGDIAIRAGDSTGASGTAGGDVILDPGSSLSMAGRVKILDSSANALSLILSGFTADRTLTVPNRNLTLGTGTDPQLVSGTAGTDGNLVQWNADGDAVDSTVAASSITILPVDDGTAIAKGSVDPTKKVQFEVDGLTTGETTVITVPDKDITLDDAADSRPPSGTAGGDLGGTYPSPTVTAVQTDAVGDLADIAATLRSGMDTTLVTGTAGTDGNLVQWNADGDAVDSTIAATSVVINGASGSVTLGGAGDAITIADVLRLTPISVAPTCNSGAEGSLYADSDTQELCYCDGSAWTGLKAAGVCA